MAEEDALVLYISTSVMAKAVDCETVRAGMGLLVDEGMGKDRSRDRWLWMEKTQSHSVQRFSGPMCSVQLMASSIRSLLWQRSYRRCHRPGCISSRFDTVRQAYSISCSMCIRSTACQPASLKCLGWPEVGAKAGATNMWCLWNSALTWSV